MDLITLWSLILGFAVFVYVVLDGFDLGIGILFSRIQNREQRDLMMNSVAPVWDGNETWLILGGGGLFAAFPLAYAVLMPAVYIPVILMLLGLVFRGVAFEFRWQTERWRKFWDWGFNLGSMVATLCQGLILGTILQGIEMTDRQYSGGTWDWLTPFSVLTAVSVLAGYVLMGSCWLIMKTSGELEQRARHYAGISLWATLIAFAAVSLWTPFLEPVYFERWFHWPGILLALAMPLSVAVIAWWLYRNIKQGSGKQAFVATCILFALGFVGFLFNFYPNVLPPDLTFAAAAASPSSLKFTLVGTAVLIPLILIYTAYSYWVFRGKIDPEEGYH